MGNEAFRLNAIGSTDLNRTKPGLAYWTLGFPWALVSWHWTFLPASFPPISDDAHQTSRHQNLRCDDSRHQIHHDASDQDRARSDYAASRLPYGDGDDRGHGDALADGAERASHNVGLSRILVRGSLR